MRITHFINLPNLGGIERLFLAMIESPSADVEHQILLSDDMGISIEKELKNFPGEIKNYKRWCGIRIPGWPRSLRKLLLSQELINNVVPDVLIMWSQLNAREIALAYKKLGVKIIYYEHGSAWLCKPEPERLAFLNEVDGIFCASRACARMLNLRWGILEKKITVCTNPLLPELKPPVFPFKKVKDMTKPLQLGVAGRLVSLKGFGIAIGAIKKLVLKGIDCELHIAGAGPLEKELKALASELGVDNKIVFRGFVDDMGKFFESLDIFLCPSLREPFGLVSIEASAWGCPVVAADVDGLSETLVDGETGFLVVPTRDPKGMREVVGENWPEYVYESRNDKISPTLAVDPEDFANAIIKASDPVELATMGENASKFTLEKFDYQKYLNHFKSSIEGLL